MAVDESVEETIKNIVTRIVRKPDIAFTPKSTFKDLEADSLDVVQILVAIEDAYDIEIPDEDLRKLRDIGGFVSYVERKVAEKNPADVAQK